MRTRGPSSATPLTQPRHWTLSILISLLLVMLHILLAASAVVVAVVILATLSHRTVILLRLLWERRRVGGNSLYNLLWDAQTWWDALYFTNSDNNPILLIYGDIFQQLGGVVLDLCYLGTPFLAWVCSVVTLYSMPLLVRELWEAPEKLSDVTGEISSHMVVHGIFIVRDMGLLALVIPLVLTVHRLPFLRRRFKDFNYYSDWKTSQPFDLIYDEFRKIGRCSVASFSRLVDEEVGDVDEEGISKEEMGKFEHDEDGETEKEKETETGTEREKERESDEERIDDGEVIATGADVCYFPPLSPLQYVFLKFIFFFLFSHFMISGTWLLMMKTLQRFARVSSSSHRRFCCLCWEPPWHSCFCSPSPTTASSSCAT